MWNAGPPPLPNLACFSFRWEEELAKRMRLESVVETLQEVGLRNSLAFSC